MALLEKSFCGELETLKWGGRRGQVRQVATEEMRCAGPDLSTSVTVHLTSCLWEERRGHGGKTAEASFASWDGALLAFQKQAMVPKPRNKMTQASERRLQI